MTKPTLTAFIGNYNHAETIGRQIEAMASQSRPPDELIVVDDCSTDNSVEVVEGYAKQVPYLRLLRHEKNQKLSGAIQTALQHAKGDFFYSGAADDFVLPGFFERTMALAEQRPELGILMAQMEVRSAENVFETVYGPSVWKEDIIADPERFLEEFLWAEHATVVYSSSAIFRTVPFAEHGGFRLELGSAADNLILRVLGALYGAGYAHLPGSVWFRNPGSMSDGAAVNPWWNLDLAARIAWLMRNQYAGIFPEAYVRQWEQQFRSHAIDSSVGKLQQAHETAKWTYRRATRHAGRAGRLTARTIELLHRAVWRSQERTLVRILNRYEGNTDCYTRESQ